MYISFFKFYSLLVWYKYVYLNWLPSSGCDHVIDKSKEDLWTAAETHSPKGYQVVFDANGVETLQGSYDHLAPGGKLVAYGMSLI